jgi:hypothetical protein
VLALLLALAVATSGTSLKITVWPGGADEASYTRTLSCDPAGGTLRRPAEACRRLAAMSAPFAPVPKDAICTMIYGGPSEAVVTGRYRGSRIWTRFTKRDGCQISRWNRHSFLFGR